MISGENVNVYLSEIDVSAYAVPINVYIKNNSGFTSFNIIVNHKSLLAAVNPDGTVKFEAAEKSPTLNNVEEDQINSQLTWVGADTTTINGDGLLATFYFKLPANAEAGDAYEISFDIESFSDINSNMSDITVSSQSAYIYMKQNVPTGDVDGNGTVNYIDAYIVQTWLLTGTTGTKFIVDEADLNGDGLVNSFDLAILKNKLSNL